MSEPKWLALAREEIGLKEVTGGKHNPNIVRMFEEIGQPQFKDDETAWCAAFVGAMLERAGIRSSRSAAARSYMNWGRPIDKPVPGCIVVFWRGKKDGWQGHVGFYVGETAKMIKVLSGNQSNAVNVSNYSKDQLLGYRMPVVSEVIPPRPPIDLPDEPPQGEPVLAPKYWLYWLAALTTLALAGLGFYLTGT